MDWLRYNRLYFTISLVLIVVGAFSLVNWGLRLGVEFTGGSIAEYEFESDISTEEMTVNLEEAGIKVHSVQSTGDGAYFFRLAPLSLEEKKNLKSTLSTLVEGDVNELRFETVGPSIGPELVKKTVYAIGVAAGGILLWVAYQFKSFKFGTSAILAMFHDSFILIGSFALLGHFFGAEVDFLFVTALLTTLSFSVHDTIVVYDRIRESQSSLADELKPTANKAISETMVRSLNNSFTIMFMLIALLLLGGTTVKWFAAALLIGTILGTYSSPFVAVPLLIVWEGIGHKIRVLRKK